MTAASALGRRRSIVLLILAVAVLCALGGWWASTLVRSPAQVAADAAAPPPSTVTAAVEKRVLQNAIVVRGTVAPSQTIEVKLRAGAKVSGDAIVTAVPVAAGQTIAPGAVLIEVSGRPVIALAGAVPAYRDLTPGLSGADVTQLQKALAGLGYSVAASGTFDARTKTAVSALYASLGYTAPPTSDQDADLLQAAQDQVTATTRAVQDAQTARDEATAAANDPSATPPPGGDAVAAATLQLQRAQEDAKRAAQGLAQVQATTGPMLPASEVVMLPAASAEVRTNSYTVGAAVADGAIQLSTGDLQVTAPLDPSQVGLVKAGEAVSLTSEVLDQTVTGTVVTVEAAQSPAATGTSANGAVATPGGGAPASPTLVVHPDAPLPAAWAGQDVRTSVVAAATAGEVLVVPVSAVFETADERTQVTVRSKAGAERHVEVRTGVSGAGFVEVTPLGGGSLLPGDRVVVGVTTAPPGEPVAP